MSAPFTYRTKKSSPLRLCRQKTEPIYLSTIYYSIRIKSQCWSSPSPDGYAVISEKASAAFYLLEEVTKENIYRQTGKTPVVVTGEGSQTDIPRFFAMIKAAGFDHILIELPMLMWLLMKEKLLNEFFITYSSIFVGGQYSPGYFSPFTFDDHPQKQSRPFESPSEHIFLYPAAD